MYKNTIELLKKKIASSEFFLEAVKQLLLNETDNFSLEIDDESYRRISPNMPVELKVNYNFLGKNKKTNQTLLHYLFEQGEFDLINALLQFKIELSHFNTDNSLIETKDEEADEKDDFFYPFMHSINEPDEQGNTLLHLLIQGTVASRKEKELSTLKILFALDSSINNEFNHFSYMVNPFIKNKAGKTPAELFRCCEQPTDQDIEKLNILNLEGCLLGADLNLNMKYFEQFIFYGFVSNIIIDKSKMPKAHIIQIFSDLVAYIEQLMEEENQFSHKTTAIEIVMGLFDITKISHRLQQFNQALVKDSIPDQVKAYYLVFFEVYFLMLTRELSSVRNSLVFPSERIMNYDEENRYIAINDQINWTIDSLESFLMSFTNRLDIFYSHLLDERQRYQQQSRYLWADKPVFTRLAAFCAFCSASCVLIIGSILMVWQIYNTELSIIAILLEMLALVITMLLLGAGGIHFISNSPGFQNQIITEIELFAENSEYTLIIKELNDFLAENGRYFSTKFDISTISSYAEAISFVQNTRGLSKSILSEFKRNTLFYVNESTVLADKGGKSINMSSPKIFPAIKINNLSTFFSKTDGREKSIDININALKTTANEGTPLLIN